MVVHWYTVVVASLALLALGAVAVWGRSWGLPEDAHSDLLTFFGALGMMVLAYMRSAFSRLESKDDSPER